MILFSALIPLLLRWPRSNDSTLQAPAVWMLFSLSAIGIGESLAQTSSISPSTLLAVRYACAASTLCPFMALLGAKRPQNAGWQFIVATFWGILILPVGEMLVLWRGGELDIGPAREWLLLLLLLVGLSNHIITRFGASCCLATVGQTLLLLPYLPLEVPEFEHRHIGGQVSIAVAVWWVAFQATRSPTNRGWDRVWQDFRDRYGLIWGLRVMERINSTAKVAGWDRELTWFGLTAGSMNSTPGQDLDEKVDRAMRSILCRFVSNTWIDQRLKPADGTPLAR